MESPRIVSRKLAFRRSWMLFVLGAPIWADTVRRFFWYSDVMFFVVTFLAIFTVSWLLATKAIAFDVTRRALISFVILSVWATGIFFMTHNNIKIFSVWILATYLPVLFLFISSYLYATDEQAGRWLYYSCTFWVFVMAVVAFLEVWLGLSHPINHLPHESMVTSVELRQGVGDYTVESGGGDTSYIGMDGIFRPTSIFLSNGKFGQTLFTLVLFRWIYLYKKSGRLNWITFSTLLIDLLALAISGQRSAFVLLSIFAGAAIVVGVLKGNRRAIRMAIGTVVFGAVGLSTLLVLKPELADLLTGRYISGFTDISERLTDNLIAPSATIVHLFGLIGMGPGFFSLGAQNFGGVMMWQVLATSGNAESAWMRIVAELGIVGLILYLCYYAGLLRQAVSRALSKTTIAPEGCLFAFAWLLGMALWGVTHDTFANAFGMAIGFGLCGAAFVPRKIRQYGVRGNVRPFRLARPRQLTQLGSAARIQEQSC